MARYRVMENIPAGDTLWFDEARREVRAKRVSDCRTIDSRRPMICTAGLIVGDEINPDSNAVFIGGKVEAMSAHVLYAPDPVAEETKSYEFQFDPADLHRFTLYGANQTSNLVDVQPKYGESAMKSEALGGQPKPKRHWIIRRGDHLSLGHTDYAWIVELHEGEIKPELRIYSTMLRSLHFWPEKRGVFCTRQMTLAEVNDEIVKSKARLLGEQAIVDSQSGPANRMV